MLMGFKRISPLCLGTLYHEKKISDICDIFLFQSCIFKVSIMVVYADEFEELSEITLAN